MSVYGISFILSALHVICLSDDLCSYSSQKRPTLLAFEKDALVKRTPNTRLHITTLNFTKTVLPVNIKGCLKIHTFLKLLKLFKLDFKTQRHDIRSEQTYIRLLQSLILQHFFYISFIDLAFIYFLPYAAF